jgi:hypothetical protein
MKTIYVLLLISGVLFSCGKEEKPIVPKSQTVTIDYGHTEGGTILVFYNGVAQMNDMETEYLGPEDFSVTFFIPDKGHHFSRLISDAKELPIDGDGNNVGQNFIPGNHHVFVEYEEDSSKGVAEGKSYTFTINKPKDKK